jgi:ribosomal protein S18 acetylase RimI-like enzyme
MTIVIREANLADVTAIADVHVTAWYESYRGIVPDAVMAARGPAERARLWRETLIHAAATDVFVADVDGEVIGFASCGPATDCPAVEGEIYAIYVLKRWQYRGVGSRLMGAMANALSQRGCNAIGLWVTRENVAAIAFYRALGGVIGPQRREAWSGHGLSEIAITWADTAELAAWGDAAIKPPRPSRKRRADGGRSRSVGGRSGHPGVCLPV